MAACGPPSPCQPLRPEVRQKGREIRMFLDGRLASTLHLAFVQLVRMQIDVITRCTGCLLRQAAGPLGQARTSVFGTTINHDSSPPPTPPPAPKPCQHAMLHLAESCDKASETLGSVAESCKSVTAVPEAYALWFGRNMTNCSTVSQQHTMLTDVHPVVDPEANMLTSKIPCGCVSVGEPMLRTT